MVQAQWCNLCGVNCAVDAMRCKRCELHGVECLVRATARYVVYAVWCKLYGKLCGVRCAVYVVWCKLDRASHW
eukprot:2393222-Pyramimonas_sp.AAC.1